MIIVFYVDIMNSKPLVKEKNGHVEQIDVSLPLLNVTLYGSLRSIPGQGLELHFSVSSLAPGHSNPPLAGEGLVQVLERLRLPPPQVTPQEPQSLHSLHEPLTKKENMK